MAPTPEGFSDYGFSDYGEYILFLNRIRNGRKGTINLPWGVNFQDTTVAIILFLLGVPLKSKNIFNNKMEGKTKEWSMVA